jgi:hypothetical protein
MRIFPSNIDALSAVCCFREPPTYLGWPVPLIIGHLFKKTGWLFAWSQWPGRQGYSPPMTDPPEWEQAVPMPGQPF